MVLLSPCFRGGVGGVKYRWRKCSSNFSSQNKFITVFLCGLLVDDNTFSKMYVFKSLTGCSVDGGYENRNVYILIIIKSEAMKSLCWLF